MIMRMSEYWQHCCLSERVRAETSAMSAFFGRAVLHAITECNPYYYSSTVWLSLQQRLGALCLCLCSMYAA
jgi:hypothetical protein